MPLLRTTTAEGALKGMILGRAPHELQDQEVAYLQDILVSQPGYLDRRGAHANNISLGANLAGFRPAGIGACYDPSGNYRILVVFWNNDATHHWLAGAVYDSSFTFLGNISFATATGGGAGFVTGGPGTLGLAPGPVVLAPSIEGGLIIGYSMGYGSKFVNGLFNGHIMVVHWRGGYSSTFSASQTGIIGVATIAGVYDSTTITGSAAEIAKLQPGVCIQLMGTVKVITSTTTAELMAPNRISDSNNNAPGVAIASGSRTIHPVELISAVRTRGLISCSAGGSTVSGFGTRFQEMMQADFTTPSHNDGWVLRDLVSGALIAKQTTASITSITSDTALAGGTIYKSKSLSPAMLSTAQSPGVAPSDAPIEQSSIPWASFNKGFVSWQYAGHQFYANSHQTLANGVNGQDTTRTHERVWIAGPNRIDEFDHSRDDGSFFDIPNSTTGDTRIYAGIGSVNFSVLCKANSTFAITGSDLDSFDINKILSDGALGANAITTWQNNVIWLGKQGVWMFDGENAPVNLVKDSLALEWSKRTAAFQTESAALDADTYLLNRAYCFVYRDHLFINITNTGSVHQVYTDGIARTVNPMQLMIYLPNNALSFISNFNFVGFLDNVAGNAQEGYALLPQQGSTTHFVYPMSNFFKQGQGATDAFLTATSTLSGPSSVGPWYHMESRKFDADSGLGKKAWKQLAIEFNMTNTKQIFMETVNGLNTVGLRATLPFVGSGLFQAKKIKFRARDQYMSFRLYEDIANRPSTLTVGAWQWAYKYDRAGAI